MLTTVNILWQMLFATVADGIATCDYFTFTCMADVIAMCLSGRCYKPLTDALFWQMLLPSSRWKSHWQGGCVMADVIARGRWKNHKVNYFNFSSELLNRTSSQTCGKWYFPTFLFRDGSLTLTYRASFIVLIRFKSSLPTMLKLLMVTLWPVMLLWSYMGEGGFQMFLEPFSKSSWGLSNVFLIAIYPVTLVFVDDSTLFLDWIFVFGRHQEIFDGRYSLEVHCYLIFAANVLDALTQSTIVWNHSVGLLLVVCIGSLGWSLDGILVLGFHLYLVESPGGINRNLQWTFQMLYFFLPACCGSE